ncbi:MAG: ABC transporter ATP-binding protein [Planctomycetota bacterium]|nr:ABC transporter ATP-binding protein [Planctomycetota bacterium]
MNLALRNISIGYDGVVVASDISLDANEGTILSLLGPNGSGKSTLLRTIAGLRTPISGTVHLDRADLFALDEPSRARLIAYFDQQPSIVGAFEVRQIVEMGAWLRSGSDSCGINAPLAVLKELDLESIQEKPWTTLSQGQRHRVALARALVQCGRGVLVLDEPFAAMDTRNLVRCARAVQRRARDGAIVIAAIHDIALAASWSTQVAWLQNGRILASGAPSDVLTQSFLETASGVPHRSNGCGEDAGAVVPDWDAALSG